MKPYFHSSVGAALLLISGAIFTGCGGGGGGGSDGSPNARATETTVVLANNAPPEAEADTLMVAEANENFGFGFIHRVPMSQVLSLTVTVTEIYFQYCADSETETPEVVLVNDTDFDPSSLTIKEGDTVRWQWTTDTPHTITSGRVDDANSGALFDQEGSETGATVDVTFEDKGIYPYFSDTEADIAAGMTGVIYVKRDNGNGNGNHNHHNNHDNHHNGNNHNHHDNHRDAAIDARHHDDDDNGEISRQGVQVFEGAFDVNLLDLTSLSQILTTAEIPPEEYCLIRMRIENPRLVLKSNPNQVITSVRLTANGQMFIKEHFEILEGENTLILLDFGKLRLIRFDHTNFFVLSPFLKADVDVVGADRDFNGTIVSVDPALNSIAVENEDGDVVDVSLAEATITTDDDIDDAFPPPTGVLFTLTADDLAAGQLVHVVGTLDISGEVQAQEVEVADESIDTTTL